MQPDLDDIGGARELALYRIGVAKDDFASAEMNFDNGHYRASNNRAYYASDYDDFYVISVEEAKEQLETAKEVIEMVEKYLQMLNERD